MSARATAQPMCSGRFKVGMQVCSATAPRPFAALRCGPFSIRQYIKFIPPQLHGWADRKSIQQVAAAARPQPSNSNRSSRSISPTMVLQALELLAIATAAACQAAVLLQAALAFSQAQYASAQASAAAAAGLPLAAPEAVLSSSATAAAAGTGSTQQAQPAQQQCYVAMQPSSSQQSITGPGSSGSSSSGGSSPLLSLALLVALICGSALRYLQQPRQLLQSGSPSADAAARLVALEVATQQQGIALTTASRQLDKLQARMRVATSDLKAPFRQVQGSAGQAAAAIVKLSEQQQRLQQQLEGSQELIGALHALAAKQFKVSADALQQLKQGQAQLTSSTAHSLDKLAVQQQRLQEQLQQQRQQLRALEQQLAVQQQQQQKQHLAVGLHASLEGDPIVGTDIELNGSGSSSIHGSPPDPWMKNGSSHTTAVAAGRA